MSNFNPDIDNEEAYDAEISPLMAKIIETCKRLNIPFVASFQYADDGFCTSCLLPPGCNDGLRKAERIIRGDPPVFAFTITSKPAPPDDASR